MSKRPNVLFLMTDQMQGRVLEPGHPCQTPNLDRLAQRGVRIERAVTPNPVCSPARASLMTGRLPHSHGVVQVTHCVNPNQAQLDTSLPHWAQRLTDAGYRTAMVGKWHAEPTERPEDFGWQEIYTGKDGRFQQRQADLRNAIALPQRDREVYVDQPAGYKPTLLAAVTDEPVESRTVGVAVHFAEQFLSSALDGEQPWALYVSVTEPHDPFVAGRAAYARYRPDELPLPANANDDLADKPGLYRKSSRAWAGLSDEQKRHVMACYYATITEVDEQFGRLIDLLEARGGLENTIVILSSDHGELLGAHGLYLKNTGAFEEAYHVPMVLAGPGIARGKTAEARVSLMDVCPTICELASVEPIENNESRSFAPLLQDPEGQAPNYQRAYAEYYGTRYWLTQRVLWDGPWKLVINGFDEDELYNLAEDPHELRNLVHAAEGQEPLQRLTARFWQIVQETNDHSLANSGYGALRYASAGPHQHAESLIAH